MSWTQLFYIKSSLFTKTDDQTEVATSVLVSVFVEASFKISFQKGPALFQVAFSLCSTLVLLFSSTFSFATCFCFFGVGAYCHSAKLFFTAPFYVVKRCFTTYNPIRVCFNVVKTTLT